MCVTLTRASDEISKRFICIYKGGKMKFKSFVRAAILLVALSFLYFNNMGDVEAAGWVKSGSNWKYDDGNGIVKDRWMNLDGKWFYFGSDGIMYRGYHTIKGKGYYFAPGQHGSWADGMMMTQCWQNVNGKYMYFNSLGVYITTGRNEDNSYKGIDVSQFQGVMDWNKVKEEGISFTFIRVGHGNHNIDPYFATNMKKAQAAGIKTGVYFYSTAKSAYDSRLDAQWVIDQLKGYNVDYPVAIDMEEGSTTFLGKQTLTYIAKVFCDELRAAGYTPMVYCNENWAINFLDLSSMDNVYKWIARYDNTYTETIKRDIWQANSKTLLNGITVNSVDIDFGYTDFSTIVTPRTSPKAGYTKNTTPVPARSSYTASQTGWQKTGKNWWFRNADGSYPKNKWQKIEGKWYYFNSKGYMKTGMFTYRSKRYFLKEDGARAECEWINYKGKYYYADENGKLVKGWVTIDRKKYHFSSKYVMQTGWLNLKSGRYYLGGSGAMFKSRFFNYKGKTYYFTKNGTMARNKWLKIKNKYYYFYANGNLARSTTIGQYEVDEDGVRIDPSEQTTEDPSNKAY